MPERALRSRWWEHRIPPPVIDGACAALMWWLAHAVPQAQCWPRGDGVGPMAGAMLLAVLGGAVALAGVHAVGRQRTTVNPLAPYRARVLVTDGIYRFTRNPMYLGMLLILAAWAVWLGNMLSGLILPLSMWVLTLLQIWPEERILRQRFGPAYADYAARVRRWL